MATSDKMKSNLLENIDDQFGEIFCIIWLDGSTQANDNRDTEQHLRSIINRLKRFTDVEQCEKYINQRSSEDRLILIVSGRLGRKIVPIIHPIRQVISVYVYCMDEAGNKDWSKKYSKVKAVVTNLDKLVSQIKIDHRIQQIIEQPLSINIFTGNSTGGVNGGFIFSQVLIECLIRLKPIQDDTNELIKHCKKIYEGNGFEINHLIEFQKQYSSNKAVWWYTRDTFFFKTLNAILRTKNIHMMFLFRAYIADIQQQLKTHQVKSSVRAYRGQVMSSNELKTLQNSCGEFISLNSFFSTSINDKQARLFLDVPGIPENLERVLFEIIADPAAAATKPFADISSLSEFPGESEILFMIGSIFRLNSIIRSSDRKLWIIRMTLCNENDSEFKNVLVYMKQQLGSTETNLRTLGKVLYKMGILDLAEFYLTRSLNNLPSKHPLLGDLYADLAEVAGLAKNYDKSVEYQRKALEHKGSSGVTDKIYTGENRKQIEAERPFSSLQQRRRSSWAMLKDSNLLMKGAVPSPPKKVSEEEQNLRAKSSRVTNTDTKERSQNNVPPTTWPAFFDLGLQIASSQNMSLIKIDNGATHIEIIVRTPYDVELMGTLKNSKDEKILGGDRVFFDRDRKLWRCLFAPDQNDTFEATIFAKRKSDTGTYKGAISYTLEARQISSTPLSYPKTWQRFYDLGLKIEAPHDRATLVWSENAYYIEICMRAPNNVCLSSNIKYNGIKVDQGTLIQFDSNKYNWQLLFAPQHTGLHTLCIYGRHENDGSSTFNSVAQFHLNVTQLKQSIKFPLTYGNFETNKCRIIEPIYGSLRKDSLVLIHWIVPDALDVKLMIDSNWSESGGYRDPVFKKIVMVGFKDVVVYAKYHQKDSYDGLFKYTVQ